MTSHTDLSPFMKALVSSSLPTRTAALTSLSTYLSAPSRQFTPLDHLKIQKSLFYTLFHTSGPLAQQRLCRSLTSLLYTLPLETFLGHTTAFWETMAREWGSIQGLRLDKYLLLCRGYVEGGFGYCGRKVWEREVVERYMGILEEGVMDPGGKVPDGLRYHVLDVWVDGLGKGVEKMPKWVPEWAMRPMETLAREGKTKVLRQRAKGVLADERLKEWMGEEGSEDEEANTLRGDRQRGDTEDDEWEGMGD